MRQSETFVDKHCVRHTVVVRHSVRRAQEQEGLDRHVHGEYNERALGERQSDAAIMLGACDLGGRPSGFAPKSSRHERGNTHLSKSIWVREKLKTVLLTPESLHFTEGAWRTECWQPCY